MDTFDRRIVGTLLFVALFAATAGRTPLARAAGPGPTLATEDTMRTSVPEVLVRAPRVTLDEILDRVARGEARRESALVDMSFVASFRALRDDKPGQPPQLVRETVYKVYKKRPDRSRGVLLRDWRARPKKSNAEVRMTFGSSMGEQAVNFAFRPEGRRDFKFRIVGRDLVGGHLVYRIAFEPKSVLDPGNPDGLVWVDTNDFVIVRQEISWKRSPVPVLLRSLPRLVIERGRVGEHWVMKRMLLRGELTIPIPEFGRKFDMAWRFDDYTINTALPDSLFPAKGQSARPIDEEDL